MEKKNLTVGLVMPISKIGRCDVSHWIEVRNIIEQFLVKALKDEYELKIKIVSEGDSTHVIHNTILENLLAFDLIIVDISCKNANVMFEFGVRFALNKKIMVLKDVQTKTPFDVNAIQYVPYDRDLNELEEFEREFNRVLNGTLKNSKGLISAFRLDNEWNKAIKPTNNSIKISTSISQSSTSQVNIYTEFKKAIANYCIDFNRSINFLEYDIVFENYVLSKVIGFYSWDARARLDNFNRAKNELQMLF